MSNDPGEPDATGGRAYPPLGGSTSFPVNLPTAQVTAFNAALATLQTTLNKFSQQASTYASSFNKITTAMSGTSGGGGGSSINTGLTGAMFGANNERGWMRDVMMFPSRFIRSAVTDNRAIANMASAGLSSQAFGAGTDTTRMMGALAGQFGNVLGGSPQDLINLMQVAGQVGAGVNWQGYTGMAPRGQYDQPRAAGFLRSVSQAQMINPGESVGTLATQIGSQLANVGSQQQAAFLTGGAFAMIGPGNRAKTIQEWSESILKYLQNLRPGAQHGKPFSYGELMSQNFPGSNIDAWLTANGVNQDMKQYFWAYAMGKSAPGSDADNLFSNNQSVSSSVAFNKLQASAATTRTGFQLAGTMGGAYANKEQSNRFFAELMGHLLNQVLPSAMSSGALSYMQYLPDTMEEIIMQLAERTSVGSAAAGVMGWGAALGGGIMDPFGDVGDVGDYGPYGGTSTAGMHPDMRKRVEGMMNANPRLRITSGYRDLGTQQRLKRKGVGRVSGRPSAHTRGMAADLGPRSEYGWISRNASRFGLNSGIGHGEPWHVGMGDIGEGIEDLLAQVQGKAAGSSVQDMQIGSMVTRLFSSLLDPLVGPATNPANQIKAIGGGSSLLLQALLGIFGGGGGTSNLAYNPDVYNMMVASANNVNFSGLPTGMSGGGGWFGNIFGRGPDGLTSGGGGGIADYSRPAGATSLEAFYTQVLRGLGAPVTRNNLQKLAAVAKYEGNGSDFNPFNSKGGDFPNKANSAGVENYPDWNTGVEYTIRLLQQTQGKGNTSALRSNLMSNGAYDSWRSAVSAFYGGWGGAGMPNISLGSADAMLSQPVHGVGDLEYAAMMSPTLGAARQAPMIFQNNFQIDGGGAGGGGINVQRTVALIADQLEGEMKRRMARTN